MVDPVLMDLEDDIDAEVFEEKEEEETVQIVIRRWVIVEYASKKTIKHYVDQVKSKEEEGWPVTFLKYRKSS